jgi:regulation of enolase protein 1 (concanavalin A-like superfamily)
MWKRCSCFVMLIVMLGGAAYGAFDPLKDPALIGWWKCDEGQGNVVADASAAHRDGAFVLGNAAWTTGASGSAIKLANPTLVEVPAMGLTLTQATMAGWVLPNGTQSDWASFIMHRGPGPAHGFNMLASRQLAYHWNDDAASWSYRGTAYYAADEWTHCAVTVEPTKATFYVNGVQASVNTIPHAAATWDGPIWFGGDRTYTDGTRHLNGALDDIMFFSRALTAAEIKDLVPPKLKAMKPIPANGATGVTLPLLQWTKGDTAVFHSVYFGTTPNLTEANLVAKNQPFAMYYHIAGLQPGTTYYWRIDEIDATGTVITGDVWSFSSEPLKAYAPKPADGSKNVFPSQTLSWSPGKAAAKHQVYFGSVQSDVASGAAAADKGKITETKIDSGLLRASTTYYWRVDEVKLDGSVEPGPVWSFSTADGVTKKIVWQKWLNLGGTAVTALTGSPDYPNNPTEVELVDVFESAVDWADNYGQRLYGWLNPPQSGDYTFWIAGDDEQQLWLSTDANPANVVRIANVPGWTPARDFDNTGGGAGNATAQKSAAIKLQTGQKYFIMALGKEGGGGDSTAVAWQGPGIATRQVIPAQYVDTFALAPLQAFSPSPADGAVDAPQSGTLSWSAGEKAQKHDVYFGEDKAAVAAADNKSPLFKGSQAGTSFSPGDLVWGKTYYWRVDEVNPAEAGSPWKGNVWSFTTATFIPVDDMESYNDTDNRIYDTWIDNFGDGSGSAVGNDPAPFAERTIVHSGKQSMPMAYNNAGPKHLFSETVREFSPLENWTGNGVDTLSLWFRGNPLRFADKGNGAFTVGASGHDIWDNADDFRFVYKSLSGNGSVTVKVESLVNTNAWAKAGVMIRESLNADSTMAYMIQSFSSGASFGWRQTTGGTCGSQTQTGIVAPQWVKLTRTGNAFTAQYSADGKAWTDVKNATGQVVSTTILMGANVYIGLCTTSHNTAATTTAEYTGAATTGTVTGQWQQAWIGDDPDRTNSSASLYVAVEDSAGKIAVATNPNPAAVNVDAWTEWKVPLSSLTGVNLAKVKKMYIGVGDRKNPVADGSGRIYIDDIRVTKP